jgi:hypothetical protein
MHDDVTELEEHPPYPFPATGAPGQTRSSTIAMPWPTPMHIVTTA